MLVASGSHCHFVALFGLSGTVFKGYRSIHRYNPCFFVAYLPMTLVFVSFLPALKATVIPATVHWSGLAIDLRNEHNTVAANWAEHIYICKSVCRHRLQAAAVYAAH